MLALSHEHEDPSELALRGIANQDLVLCRKVDVRRLAIGDDGLLIRLGSELDTLEGQAAREGRGVAGIGRGHRLCKISPQAVYRVIFGLEALKDGVSILGNCPLAKKEDDDGEERRKKTYVHRNKGSKR